MQSIRRFGEGALCKSTFYITLGLHYVTHGPTLAVNIVVFDGRHFALCDLSKSNDRTVSRGNPFKLSVNYCRTNTRINFFSERVVKVCNSLPPSIVNFFFTGNI